MRIVQLTAENVKRLTAVDITPDGDLVVIAGRNGQGKTSVLDAIWYALGGAPASKATQRPIRDGQTRANVTVDLGDIKVTRTWTTKGTTLRVESADGLVFKSPQAMLDDLIGRLSFDPLAFTQQPAREQVRTLLDLVDLPFDPAALDARRAAVFDERTGINREVKRLQAQLDGLPQAPAGTPEEEVSVADLIERRDVMQRQQDQWVRAADVIEELDQRVAQLREQLKTLEGRRDAARAAQQELPVPPDDAAIAAVNDQLRGVDDTNRAVRARQQRTHVTEQLQQQADRAEALTDQLADIDRVKRDGLAQARMPITGLGFDDTGVTYRAVPFAQCSGAEQLRVSVAMAMAMNPKVRVIRITDGSLLDRDNLALIEQMAGEQDYQVWIERVDDTGLVGVVIEDGTVSGVSA